MPFTLIPGVRQNHDGSLYQYERNDETFEIRTVHVETIPSMSYELEQIEVQSLSDLPLPEGRSLPWVLLALERGSLFKRGEKFMTMRLFRMKRE